MTIILNNLAKVIRIVQSSEQFGEIWVNCSVYTTLFGRKKCSLSTLIPRKKCGLVHLFLF